IEVFENSKSKQSLDEFIAEQDPKSEYDRATERPIAVNGFIGKEYLSVNKAKPAMVQFFATEKRLYRFTASGSGAQHAGVKQFFSSIVLAKKTEGTKVSDGPGLPLEPEMVGPTYTGKDVDTKARLISKPEPTYTERARQKETVGAVVLRCV